MAIPFSRSTRSLNADSYRRSTFGLLIVIAVLGAWTAWLGMARIALYEVTAAARLEVDTAVHPVQSPLFGRVVATHLTIGQEVKVGDVLVELDSKAERLQLGEEEARVAGLAAQLQSLRSQGVAEQQAHIETQQRAPVAIEEAQARFEEAEAVDKSAAEELRRLERLQAQGLVAEMDLVRAQAEAQKRRAAANALHLSINRVDRDQRVLSNDRQADLEKLRSEVASLEGQILTSKATIERLQHEIERRRIRSSAAGRVGEVADLRVGSVVREGDKLGTIIPAGTLRAVAEFEPSAALGRIEPGQRAQMRLDGFPWTEYGSIAATVANVASEPRSGRVRVEFAVHPNTASPIPLQHGLPGAVEVQVDWVSPMALVLRTAGQLLTNSTEMARLQRKED